MNDRRCYRCDVTKPYMKQCYKCKIIYYCSNECEERDSVAHRGLCRLLHNSREHKK